jgi:hypothetical protein
MIQKPLNLLQTELDSLIRARDKSVKSFEKGEIDKATHTTHMENLTPMIEEYKYTIRVINTYA